MKKVFNILSAWLNKHKTILTLLTVICTSGFTFVTSKLVFADDFEEYKKYSESENQKRLEIVIKQQKQLERLDLENDLQDAHWEIDHYLRQGERNLNAFELERLERARRQRDSIEDKLNSLSVD